LVEQQAQRIGAPLWAIDLPWPCSNAEYEEIMRGVLQRAVDQGIAAVAFGDLFLQDIRDYRERQMAGTGLEALFPVWGLPTHQLARDMIAAGVRAKLTCVDPKKLDRSYAGRDFDLALLESLPVGIDPCGENGEFHTFVYAAPIFDRPIDVTSGDIVERDGFVFADVVPFG
jgi:diphthamide synthase (EF-2-diphthine--ammonia ligase)